MQATTAGTATRTAKAPRKRTRGGPNGLQARQMSSYGQRLDQDVSTFLSMLCCTPVRKLERSGLHRRLKSLISSHFGPRFDVEDVSMWRFAHDLQDAPLEFAIVDKEFPLGLKQSAGNDKTPYSPRNIATLLASGGFQGVFISSPSLESVALPEKSQSTPREYSSPWPNLGHQGTTELVFPTRLETRSPSSFTIWSPGPTIQPLMSLLRSYTKLRPDIPDTISFLHLWTRSFDIHGFTPVCLALMVIHFYQVRMGLPILQSPPTKRGDESQPSPPTNLIYPHVFQRLFTESSEMELLPVRLKIATWEHSWDLGNRKPGMLVEFFRYWVSVVPKLPEAVVSVRGRKIETRPLASFRVENINRPTTIVPTKGPIGGENTQFKPAHWQLHPLVVQDPFVFTHNHADSISPRVVNQFNSFAQLTSTALHNLSPITDVLGRRFTIPKKLNPTFSGIESSSIGTEILQLYMDSRVPDQVLQNRIKTMKRIQDVINRFYDKRYKVEPFGSTCYGVDSATSDLDLVITDPARRTGFQNFNPPSKGKKKDADTKIYNIRLLGNHFQRAGFKDIVCIPSAKVPIVKLTDPCTGLCCDINVNDRLGCINTALIKQYCDMLPILRPLVYIIKRWAKPLGLNSPSTAEGTTFSSYALTLMTIGWFQTQGLLPNLQSDLDNCSGGSQEDVFWVRTRGNSSLKCDTRFRVMRDWKPKHRELGLALVEWFRYWGIEHCYEDDMMSVRHGGLIPSRHGPASNTPFIKAKKDDKAAVGKMLQFDDGAEASTASTSHAAMVIEESPDDMLDEEIVELEDEDEELNEFDIPLDLDPVHALKLAPLYIPDPFITNKNAVSAISFFNIQRFQAECVYALKLLDSGYTIRDLLRIRDDLIGAETISCSPPTPTPSTTSRNQAKAKGKGKEYEKAPPAKATAKPKPKPTPKVKSQPKSSPKSTAGAQSSQDARKMTR